MQRYGSVYLVTNTVTKEQYVGQTRQKPERRWKTHINTANSAVAPKYLLAQAILKYGTEVFRFSEVFCAFDADALNSAEIEWIAAVAPAYNITKGGAGHRGVVASPEVCKARSERIKRKWADPVWRAAQVEKLKQLAATPEAVARGRAVAAIGIAARWAKHVKKPKPLARIKAVKPRKDPVAGKLRAARAKWKPVLCPELQVSFLSQKFAAEQLGVLTTSVANALKTKGKVNKMFTLIRVA